MTRTVRATIEIADPSSCPVARTSTRIGTSIDDVSRSSPTEEGTVLEEFAVPTGETTPADDPAVGDAEAIFECGPQTVYRIERDAGVGCVCECVERFGCPVADVRAVEGSLLVTCHLSDAEQFRALVTDLRERFGGVAVRELTRSGGGPSGDLRVVDRGRLTDRQRRALETAHELGYFGYPKGANAGDVADALDIAPATFVEHLSAAQRKLLDDVLDD